MKKLTAGISRLISCYNGVSTLYKALVLYLNINSFTTVDNWNCFQDGSKTKMISYDTNTPVILFLFLYLELLRIHANANKWNWFWTHTHTHTLIIICTKGVTRCAYVMKYRPAVLMSSL